MFIAIGMTSIWCGGGKTTKGLSEEQFKETGGVVKVWRAALSLLWGRGQDLVGHFDTPLGRGSRFGSHRGGASIDGGKRPGLTLSSGAELKINQKTVCHTNDSHTTIAPVGTSCLVDKYYSLQGPELDKITDVFSLHW